MDTAWMFRETQVVEAEEGGVRGIFVWIAVSALESVVGKPTTSTGPGNPFRTQRSLTSPVKSAFISKPNPQVICMHVWFWGHHPGTPKFLGDQAHQAMALLSLSLPSRLESPRFRGWRHPSLLTAPTPTLLTLDHCACCYQETISGAHPLTVEVSLVTPTAGWWAFLHYAEIPCF